MLLLSEAKISCIARKFGTVGPEYDMDNYDGMEPNPKVEKAVDELKKLIGREQYNDLESLSEYGDLELEILAMNPKFVTKVPSSAKEHTVADYVDDRSGDPDFKVYSTSKTDAMAPGVTTWIPLPNGKFFEFVHFDDIEFLDDFDD